MACSPRHWLIVRWFPDKQRALSKTAAWRLQTSTTPQRVRPQSSDDGAEGLRTGTVCPLSEPTGFLIAVDTQTPWTALAARGPPAAAPKWGPPGGPTRTIQVMLTGGLWRPYISQHVDSRLSSGNPPSKELAGPSLLQRPHLPSTRVSSSQPGGPVQRGTGLSLSSTRPHTPPVRLWWGR